MNKNQMQVSACPIRQKRKKETIMLLFQMGKPQREMIP